MGAALSGLHLDYSCHFPQWVPKVIFEHLAVEVLENITKYITYQQVLSFGDVA